MEWLDRADEGMPPDRLAQAAACPENQAIVDGLLRTAEGGVRVLGGVRVFAGGLRARTKCGLVCGADAGRGRGPQRYKRATRAAAAP